MGDQDSHERSGQSAGYFHILTVPSVHPAVGDQWVNQYMRFFFFFAFTNVQDTVYGVFSHPPVSTHIRGHQYVSLLHEIVFLPG